MHPNSARRLLAAALFVVVVVVAAYAVVDSRLFAGHPTAPHHPHTSTSDPDRDALAVVAVERQVQAVRTADRAAFIGLADPAVPGSRRQAVSAFANLAAIPVIGFSVRYVGQSATIAKPSVGARVSWNAQVDVVWRIRGVPGDATRDTLTYTFTRRGGVTYIADLRAPADPRTPIWLLGTLVVQRSSHTVVLSLEAARGNRVARLLRQAVRDVHRVLTSWRGILVAIVPATSAQVGQLLDSRPPDYAGIAAVTTSQDGSKQPGSQPVVVVNPTVFDRLGPVGAQVVVSHESTHVATRAISSTMPLWLIEGFADYVGVGAAGIPVSVAADRLIRSVRNGGLPAGLPSDASFRVGDRLLEVQYEGAWLACRLISAEYGQPSLVRFYRYVRVHRGHLDGAFIDVLGTTRQAFVRRWRAELRGLAGAS